MYRSLNDIDPQMKFTLEQALVGHMHVVELCELWNIIYVTLPLIQWP